MCVAELAVNRLYYKRNKCCSNGHGVCITGKYTLKERTEWLGIEEERNVNEKCRYDSHTYEYSICDMVLPV